MTVVKDQLFPQKPPGSRFRFSRTGVQPSPGSSTIELPSAFVESGAYPPDREPPGSPRQCSLPLACRHPPEGHQIGARKRRTPENTILSQPYCRRVSTDRSDREGSQLAASLEGEPGPTPAGKTLPHSYPETRFRRERARGGYRQTEMKYNKFKTNKLTKAASQDRSQKPQEYVFSNLPVSGIQRQTGMKHTKLKPTSSQQQLGPKPKTTRLQERVSCGVVLMASTMLHEKCCNTVLQIGVPVLKTVTKRDGNTMIG